MASDERSSAETIKAFRFEGLLHRGGWITPAYVLINSQGVITDILNEEHNEVTGVSHENVSGYAIPGFQNAHCHAFQYAMAGRAEVHQPHTIDDFWSWRQAMYECALNVDPAQMQSIATMLYAEMLKRGYTHVAEFHYLHHDKNGKPFTQRAEMSVSLLAAAAVAGIKITLIPVFYQKGGFGKPAEDAQRRFCFRNIDDYLKLLEDCSAVAANLSTAQMGFGVHSLRAADGDDIVRISESGPRQLPFHIHVAEQIKEISDCFAYHGMRPAEWIVENLDLTDRFHLIHCTHLDENEIERLGKSKASVVLCPSTEANLGDGFFRLKEFSKLSDRWSIGTDSNINLNPLEDLRWLDYGQRLNTHRRNTFADGASLLIDNTFISGRRAMGIPVKEYFEKGKPFDAVVYDAKSPLVGSADDGHRLSSIVYSGDSADVLGTIINGSWLVKERKHKEEPRITQDFANTMKSLYGSNTP